MSQIKQYISGSAIRIQCEVVNSSDTLITPDTSYKISIIAPDGTLLVDAVNMTVDSTGKLSYVYQTANTNRKGIYTVKIYTRDDATASLIATTFERLFELIGETIGQEILLI